MVLQFPGGVWRTKDILFLHYQLNIDNIQCLLFVCNSFKTFKKCLLIFTYLKELARERKKEVGGIEIGERVISRFPIYWFSLQMPRGLGQARLGVQNSHCLFSLSDRTKPWDVHSLSHVDYQEAGANVEQLRFEPTLWDVAIPSLPCHACVVSILYMRTLSLRIS